ncbi:MAG: S1C family serine protease [Acidimicrobiales bacterium]
MSIGRGSEHMSVVEEIEAVTRRVAEQVGPSVVAVGRGCGVVLAEGQVLTNAHNLHSAEVAVGFLDGRRSVGSVGGVDVDGDIAVVLVDTGGAPPLSWSQAARAADGAAAAGPGTVVLALANPGGRGLRVTLGQVSATGRAFRGPRGRRIRGSLEHTAPMVKGSSGGPVVSPDGELLGLNTNRLSEGFYLALPADAELRRRVEALAAGTTPYRPHLGVALAPGRAARHLRQAVGLPPRDGLLVRAVEDDSPAAEAGIATGDLLVAIGDRPLVRIDDLHEVLDAIVLHGPGDTAELAVQIVRGAQELAATVTFTVTFTADQVPEDGPTPPG